MGWGLDSPGNQYIGEVFLHTRKKERSKCAHHDERNAIALVGTQQTPVCLECVERFIKEYKKQGEIEIE